MLIFFLR